MKYLIIFNLYLKRAFTPSPAEYVVYGIKPEGARFTMRFSFFISTEELSILDRKLESIWKDEKDDIVKALRDLGECLVTLYRVQSLQQELPLDRLITTYKLLCYAATEPGYKSPLEFMYELLRILNDDNVRPRIRGLLKKYLQDKYSLSEDEAERRVNRIWSTLNELAQLA